MTTAAQGSPALLGTRPSSLTKRVARRVLMMALATLCGAAVIRFDGWPTGFPTLSATQRSLAQGAAGVLAFTLVDFFWCLLAARVLADFIVGLRLVGDDGRQHSLRCAGHEACTMVLTALTAGIAPLLLALTAGGGERRTVLDRAFALVLIDVRRGRDVQVMPVRQTEIDKAYRVIAPPGPSVVAVTGRVSEPGARNPGQTRTTQIHAGPVAQRIRLDTGAFADIAGVALIGRQPIAGGPDTGAAIIAVDDPGSSVSKTHARLISDGEGIWVEDLGSTNGTRVATAGEAPVALRPGDRRLARPRAVVRIGDRSFEVLGGGR